MKITFQRPVTRMVAEEAELVRVMDLPFDGTWEVLHNYSGNFEWATVHSEHSLTDWGAHSVSALVVLARRIQS